MLSRLVRSRESVLKTDSRPQKAHPSGMIFQFNFPTVTETLCPPQMPSLRFLPRRKRKLKVTIDKNKYRSISHIWIWRN